MTHARRTLRLTGPLALMAGLLAFSATTAQAEPGAYWLVNGSDIGTTLLPEVQAMKDSPHGIFLTKVGLSTVEILCTDLKFIGGKLHELGRITGKVHVQAPTGCITKLNGNTANACKPKSPGAALGLIETNALEGLIKLHTLANETKHGQLELKPVGASNPFVTLELGATCAIGNKINITGTGFLKDGKGEGLVNLVEHLFEEGPLSALLFGGNAAKIDGSAFAFLTGAHTDRTWSGQPA